MTNPNNIGDPVKRGMSQAIVLSDLYAPNWDCLVKDETLKEIFNRFVDKKIVFTSLFDCCYSAHLAMMPGFDMLWEDMEFPQSKSINMTSIPYDPVIKQPRGDTQNEGDTLDTDGDGYPDRIDWQIQSLPGPVDERGVNMEPDPADFSRLPDSSFVKFDFSAPDLDTTRGTKSFNLSAALKDTTRSTALRPSERKASSFVSLAATTDFNKGLEITDVNGIRHGAFTAALIEVYKTVPSDLPIASLVSKINSLMNRQYYSQGPTPHYDSARLRSNLVGIPINNVKLRAACTSVKNGMVQIDKGLLAGIFKGNRFIDISAPGRPVVQVENSFPDSSVGRDLSGGKVQKGHIIELSDPFTASKPLVRIYIPSVNISFAQLNTLVETKITPLAAKPNYTDITTQGMEDAIKLLLFRDLKKVDTVPDVEFRANADKSYFTSFLPVPSYLSEQVRAELKTDQNVELVDDISKAEIVLLINYVKARPKQKRGYVFYFNNPRVLEVNYMGQKFHNENLFVPTLQLSGQGMVKFRKDLHAVVTSVIRSKTMTWLNLYPAK
jgi:hypothetical protein